jgi:DNA repair protein RecO (recombination protein O)
MTQIKTSAIVIKSIEWSDSSKIVTLYTKEIGLIKVIARGAKKTKSQYIGKLESLNLIEVIIYYSPKRELQPIGSLTLECSFQKIRSDLNKTAIAFSIMQLISTIFELESGDEIFFVFLKELMFKLQKTRNPIIILWFFILKLISFLGFKPEFQKCTDCGKIVNENMIKFSKKDGAVVCNTCITEHKDYDIFPNQMIKYLTALQRCHYKKIEDIELPRNTDYPYTQYLLSYLEYHTNQKIDLKAMKYFR